MKKIIQLLFFVIIIGALVVFAYFYYIKPQREFIKINTQQCINSALSPINAEVAKYSPNPYKTEKGFEIMVKEQTVELDECAAKYDSIFFSKPEKNLLMLNINSSVSAQKSKIDEYLHRIDVRINEVNEQKAKKQACVDMKTVKENYQSCIDEEMKKNPGSSEILEFMIYPEKNQTNNTCLQKYNYIKFGVSETDCMMMDIFSF